ncbi:hypothetical protein FRX31_027863, partial [Thalictrum thalictroides]
MLVGMGSLHSFPDMYGALGKDHAGSPPGYVKPDGGALDELVDPYAAMAGDDEICKQLQT